jgi:hypothetical protein
MIVIGHEDEGKDAFGEYCSSHLQSSQVLKYGNGFYFLFLTYCVYQSFSSLLICAASSGSPTGVSIAPPCATSTPNTVPASSNHAMPLSPPVVTATASPPSYPAVLKDRPPSFGKGVPPTGGVPSASGKIPPPVPPRGSPLGKRGDGSAASPRGGIVRHCHTYHQFHLRTLEKVRMSALEQHGSRLHDEF